MCSWVMLTMLVNNRLLSVGDYFEIYKLVKYVLVVYCFYYATMARWQTYVVGRHLGLIGACLVLFNVVGLLDFRWFNVVVMPYYAAEHHLEVTERLERGGDSVRMLGTMGNPNNNAVLWGFMAALFVALCVLYKRQRVLMLVGVCVAVTMCLLSQSRTTVVGLASGFLVYSLVAFQSRYFRQVTLPAMVLGGLGYVFVVSLKLQYLLSLI